MVPCTIAQSGIRLFDVIQTHARRLPRASCAGSKNQPHPPLFSGLAAAREWGNRRSCRTRRDIFRWLLFFRRGTPGCNLKDHLFFTLAYQLATNVHGMLEYVDQAMMQDFSLPMRSAAVQLKRLIVEPRMNRMGVCFGCHC